MSDESVQIGVAVPPAGLQSYAFQGLDYVHNTPVADRRTAWTVGRGVPLPRGKINDLAARCYTIDLVESKCVKI